MIAEQRKRRIRIRPPSVNCMLGKEDLGRTIVTVSTHITRFLQQNQRSKDESIRVGLNDFKAILKTARWPL